MELESVHSFYERMPYPAPVTDLNRHLASFASADRRRIRSLLMFPGGTPGGCQHILVAGCGTSQAAKVALREPDAHVVAIDISGTSLNHLRTLQKKHSIENLEIRQLSILDAASLKQSFDQIICTGVLHHLADSVLGLRSLRDVLTRNGAMQIMVYAAYGRASIYMLQEYCRRIGVTDSPQDLNDLSAALQCLPDDHPLIPLLHKFKDFMYPDALADALLHPQDRAYTVPQLHDWLDRCGMSFGRWLEQAPYLPQCGTVADTPHASRIGVLPEAEQHAAVELFRGTITDHNFIAYRSDREMAAQPVQFAGEHWRSYVPVRPAWIKIIRERIPAGSAAVLLNPVHKHHDLYLPIDAIEDHLFGQIDGSRSLAEIERGCRANNDAQRVRPFFESLWHHDQIVIDASCASIAAHSAGHGRQDTNGRRPFPPSSSPARDRCTY